ncbi:MAG: hypothetical protein LUG61_10885 [Lachnospiraceae bacterium]|nr:hypothetical protein [Lachnospiraceae bacterium]
MKITGIEQKLIAWIEAHLQVLMVIFVTFCGLFIRYFLRPIVTDDATACLIPWYHDIEYGGGFAALKWQVGNYNVLYQFMIAVLTYLPIYSLTAYKALSGIFDYALAIAGALVVGELVTEDRSRKMLLTYSAVLLAPQVWLNSAAWGQCDSIYVFWIVAAFLFLCRERYGLSFLLYGVAFAFKLQAIFALPFFLLYWFMKKRFSILHFLEIPLMMILSTIPALLAGREGGLLISFRIYADQAGEGYLYRKYPGFWALIADAQPDNLDGILPAAMIFAAVVMIFQAAVWIRKKAVPNAENALYMLFLLTYSCVLFMPGMHERYGYLYEILAILIAVIYPETAVLLAGLLGISVLLYGDGLFQTGLNLTLLSVINITVYLLYFVVLTLKICGKKPEIRLLREK